MLIAKSGLLKRGEWALLALLFIFNFIPVFGGLVRIAEITAGLQIIPPNPRVMGAPMPAAMHIISSFIFCMLGALQFMPSIRNSFSNFHKANGLVVAASGILAATTGLWMTELYNFPNELQGNFLYWMRVVVSFTMAAFIVLGIISIKRRHLKSHYSYMISAYALGLGASTQTVLGLTWLVALGNEPLGLERDLMMASSWVINLTVAQRIIANLKFSE